jgi:hypothetical protein
MRNWTGALLLEDSLVFFDSSDSSSFGSSFGGLESLDEVDLFGSAMKESEMS